MAVILLSAFAAEDKKAKQDPSPATQADRAWED